MEAAQNHRPIGFEEVEHAVGKSAERGASDPAVDSGSASRECLDSSERVRNGGRELRPERCASLRVPGEYLA